MAESVGAVTFDFIASSARDFQSVPHRRIFADSLSRNDYQDVIIDRDNFCGLNHIFSHRIATEGKATNQKSSGRCWMFAALNIIRIPTIKKFNLDSDFEFSQSYLFFFDKLEKSNWFLENVIDTVEEDVDSRLFAHIRQNPVEDGGQWDMLANLVLKYGIVPKSVFPECHSSSNSRRMNWLITIKLREFAATLRRLKREGKSVEELRSSKNDMLQIIHRILLLHFGTPPTEFEWVFYDKDKKYNRIAGLTPQTFYQEHVPFHIENLISVINDPRNEYYRTYTVSRLGNVVGGRPVLYLNLPIDDLKRISMQTISNGDPVWFGCDVGKEFHRKLGVMDTALYDYATAYDTTLNMTKEERLLYGESLMTHAMVFTGFDLVEELPRKWRVENSWGGDDADKGYFLMTDSWFNEYMYQIVVDKETLSEQMKTAILQEPIVLPPWDPMGSLALARDPTDQLLD